MITQLALRWNHRRGVYRPAAEVIDTSEYDVGALAGDTAAKEFVLRHHYSGSYPAARFRFGLFRRGRLVGVAVYSHPTNDKVFDVLQCAPTDAVELGRFVLRDEVPGNGETWFLARCSALLRREHLAGVVSFSDPLPRHTSAGLQVFGGHVGIIYQASNATYLGRATPRTLHVLPDGSVLSARAQQKIRARERGWRYAVDQMERVGAEPLGSQDARAWLRQQLPRVTRTLRHPGNHKYVWGFHRTVRARLPPSLPYPKLHF